MIKISDIPSASIDAESDALYNPENIRDGFYDYKSYLSKLTDVMGQYFFISGRKGVGKSAYIYKIKDSYDSLLIDLSSLPYHKFEKIYDDKQSVTGTIKYADIWNILLISRISNSLDKNLIKSGHHELKSISNISQNLGLSGEFLSDVETLSKKKFKLDLKAVSYESEYQQNVNPEEINIKFLSTNFSDLFSKIAFKEPYYVLIDGVDDILSFKMKKNNIIGSLIRQIKELNHKFTSNKNNIKVIMAIRTDIWNLVNGPDMNKISQTHKLEINWYSNNNNLELIKLLNKRMKINPTIANFFENKAIESLDFWNTVFPKQIQNHESWNHFLEYSLYRPRDVVQFINQAKLNYPDSNALSFSEFRNLLSNFSQEYFFDEMRNELSGFVKDDILNDLPTALQSIGRDSFKYPDFKKAMQSVRSSYKEDDIKELLILMFNNGYIGQRASERDPYSFKHKNSRLNISFANSLVIHRGLYSAVAIG